MATPTKTVTYEEWLRMPETNLHEEVVDGEIITVPPDKLPHPRVVHKLTITFSAQLDPERVEIFESSFGLVIRREPLTCRTPDLPLFKRESMVEIEGYFYSPPELLIEVLSPEDRRRTLDRKLEDYMSIGVPEVWLVSPEAATVEVLQLEDGKLVRKGIYAEGELRPLHFPEVCIDIAKIWPN